MQEYRNEGIVVRYDEKICTHSGECVKSLPAVFDIKKTPWVNVNGASLEAIKQTVQACPSGALTFEPVKGTRKPGG